MIVRQREGVGQHVTLYEVATWIWLSHGESNGHIYKAGGALYTDLTTDVLFLLLLYFIPSVHACWGATVS